MRFINSEKDRSGAEVHVKPAATFAMYRLLIGKLRS